MSDDDPRSRRSVLAEQVKDRLLQDILPGSLSASTAGVVGRTRLQNASAGRPTSSRTNLAVAGNTS